MALPPFGTNNTFPCIHCPDIAGLLVPSYLHSYLYMYMKDRPIHIYIYIYIIRRVKLDMLYFKFLTSTVFLPTLMVFSTQWTPYLTVL